MGEGLARETSNHYHGEGLTVGFFIPFMRPATGAGTARCDYRSEYSAREPL